MPSQMVHQRGFQDGRDLHKALKIIRLSDKLGHGYGSKKYLSTNKKERIL